MALNNQFKVKNDFNTLGRILSGGVDLATIFSPSNTSWKLSATNANFDISGTETLTFLGDNGVDVKASTSNESVTISGINATTSVKGVASFNADNFSVTNGEVIIKNGGIANVELATATSSNSANYVVVRGASGEFSSGSITSSGTVQAATVNATTVDIDGGTIDGTTIGANTASTGKFTQVDVDNIRIDGNTISSTNINGSIDITPQGFGVVNLSNVNIIAGSASLALLNVDNISVDANTISSINANGNIVLAPNGTGDVQLDADTVRIGDLNTAATFTTNGTGSITFNTNAGTNSGYILINQGINGDIDLIPNGTGEVNITKVDIDGGSINGTTIGLTNPMSAIFTGMTVTGSVVIDGNLFVSGSATQFNTQDLVVQDPIIFLAEGNLGDLVDIGFTAAYNHGLTPPRHTGLVRDHITKKYTLFSNLSAEILSAVDIPLNDPSIVIDTLRANIEGTLTGNVSGVAAQATQLVTGRTISTTGDVTYTSGSFDGSANVTGTATIANDAVNTVKILNSNVTYAKIQNVSATDKILGRSTAGAGVVEEITCTAAGRALLDDADAATQRTTLGVGTTDSVTFAEVIVNNGTQSVLSDVYNTSTATNVATLSTFANASYNSAKYTVQIKNTSTNARCALEIIATKNISTWEGTVYGIVDPANLFTNVDITAGPTAQLVFTLNGVASYTITAYTQAISD